MYLNLRMYHSHRYLSVLVVDRMLQVRIDSNAPATYGPERNQPLGVAAHWSQSMAAIGRRLPPRPPHWTKCRPRGTRILKWRPRRGCQPGIDAEAARLRQAEVSKTSFFSSAIGFFYSNEVW